MAFITPVGANTADSTAVNVVGDVRPANPFVKTGLTFTELVASTSEDWAGFYIVSSQGREGIMSVWKGAAASEVRVATMPMKSPLLAQDSFMMYVPIPIPSGTRLSINIAGRSTALLNEVQISGVPSSNFAAEPTFTIMDAGPFDLTNSSTLYGKSPLVDPGGTANTAGSYTELSNADSNNVISGSSLPHQYKYLGFAFGDDEQNQTAHDRLWTVAHGAAASEVDFITNLYDSVSALETNILNGVLWIPWDRASGDRISAKMQCSIIDAADRIGSVYLFGLR